MFDVVHLFALAFGFGIAPGLWFFSLMLKRKFHDALIKWRKPQAVIFTIFAFILNLTLFVLACFFLACYQGRIVGVDLLQFTPEEMWMLGIDSMILLIGVTQTHLAFQNFFTQYITSEGVVLRRFSFTKKPLTVELIPWWQIRDYYVHSDYPNTFFHFILQQPDGVYTRATLKVPFYVLSGFERVLERNLNSSKNKANATKELLKKTSKN